MQIVASYIFGNVNPDGAYFHFRILAPSGHNFPTNSGLSVQCTDNRCPINWTGTLPAPDVNGNQITGFDNYVPGNFSGSLVVTITSPNGLPFPPNAQLSITYYQIPNSPMDFDERQVAKLYSIARSQPDRAAATVTAYLIQVGEGWIYVEA